MKSFGLWVCMLAILVVNDTEAACIDVPSFGGEPWVTCMPCQSVKDTDGTPRAPDGWCYINKKEK